MSGHENLFKVLNCVGVGGKWGGGRGEGDRERGEVGSGGGGKGIGRRGKREWEWGRGEGDYGNNILAYKNYYVYTDGAG